MSLTHINVFFMHFIFLQCRDGLTPHFYRHGEIIDIADTATSEKLKISVSAYSDDGKQVNR